MICYVANNNPLRMIKMNKKKKERENNRAKVMIVRYQWRKSYIKLDHEIK